MLLIQGAHVTSSGWTVTSSLFLTSILALNTLGGSAGVWARTISEGSIKTLTKGLLPGVWAGCKGAHREAEVPGDPTQEW